MRAILQQVGLGCYSMIRRTEFLSTSLGQNLFLSAYFQYKQQLEAPWAKVIRHLVPPGTLAVDVGANVGFFTVIMAEAVGSKGRVLAFEPETFNQNLLDRVVSSKDLKTVTVVHAALGEQDGTIALHLNPNHPADHRIYAAAGLKGTQNITMTTLDNYLKRSEEHRPVSLVKIDVQGAELQVLRGMQNTLAQHDRILVIIEFHPGLLFECGENPDELIQFFRTLGFSAYLVSRRLKVQKVGWGEALSCAKTAGYVDLLLSRYPLKDHSG